MTTIVSGLTKIVTGNGWRLSHDGEKVIDIVPGTEDDQTETERETDEKMTLVAIMGVVGGLGLTISDELIERIEKF